MSNLPDSNLFSFLTPQIENSGDSEPLIHDSQTNQIRNRAPGEIVRPPPNIPDSPPGQAPNVPDNATDQGNVDELLLLAAGLVQQNPALKDVIMGPTPDTADIFKNMSTEDIDALVKMGPPDLTSQMQAAGPGGLFQMLSALPIRTAEPASPGELGRADESDFSLYAQNPDRKTIKRDTVATRTLREKEAAVADFVDVLDRSADIIQEEPGASLLPLTQAYRDLAAFERSMVETGRKLFGGGANFTEFEIRNILDQIGPFFGPSAAIRGMSKEDRLKRLETAEDLFINKVDKLFESHGLERKRVVVQGPNGTAIEVDALERPRAERLAQDPRKWQRFINTLQKPTRTPKRRE